MAKTTAVIVLLLALILAVFLPVARFDFVYYDDPGYVTDNSNVRGGFTLHGLRWAFSTGRMGSWHPLTWLSHMLDIQLFGLRAGAHHLVSLLFHQAAAVLLFAILRGMTGAAWPAFIVAALFAVHPLHVQSVAWISERKDVLSAFFWMLTTGAYLRYVRKPGSLRYALVALPFTLGLLSKPMVVTLPAVLLVLDHWPLGRFSAGGKAGLATAARRLVLEKIPLLLISAAATLVTFQTQKKAGALLLWSSRHYGLQSENILKGYLWYIVKTVWPADLAFFYPYPRAVAMDWKTWAAAALLSFLTLLSVWLARRKPYLLAGWLWYLISLVPVAGFVKMGAQAVADRYSYLPTIGLFVMAAWGLSGREARAPVRGAAAFAAAAIIGFYLVLASLQVGYWRDSVTLFNRAIRVTEDNWVAQYNLGVALYMAGRYREAAAAYRESIRISPMNVDAHYNLGMTYQALEMPREAREEYSEVLRLNPRHAQARFNLGLMYIDRGEFGAARAEYEALRGINPATAEKLMKFIRILSAGRGRKEKP